MSFYKHEADKKSGDGLALTEWNDLSNAVAGNSGLTLAMTPTDNIGIGTIPNPKQKLHVKDGGLLVDKGGLRVESSHNSVTPDIGAFLAKNLTQGIGIGYNRIEAIGSNPDQHILLKPKGNGNIGIGHDNPQATLDVTRGKAPYGTAVFRGTQRFSHFNYSTDEHTYIRGGKKASNVFINDNGGNVGIGVNTGVSEKLTVNGNVKATKFIGDGSGLTNIGINGLNIGGSPGAGTVLMSNKDGLANWSSQISTGSGSAGKFGNIICESAMGTAGGIVLFTGRQAVYGYQFAIMMHVDSDMNVTIMSFAKANVTAIAEDKTMINVSIGGATYKIKFSRIDSNLRLTYNSGSHPTYWIHGSVMVLSSNMY